MDRSQLIYVENISPTSSEQNLQVYLEKFAPVQAVYFLREKQCTKRSIAAFLRVANETDRDIIMLRNQQNYRGKRLFMLQADKPHDYQADLTIIVRNITNKISEENLFEHFEDCGKIAFLQIRTDDFAYIGFDDKSAVRNALNKNNQPLKGSSLKIQVLTRNLDIMIVNLDTLASRMPDLYRKMILPVEPRAPDNQSQPAVAEQPQHPKHQEHPRQQQQQQQPKQQQQQAQQQMSRQQQQYQQGRLQQQQRENQQRQQRENQQRQQRENQQLQQQMQAQQQQRLQQQQQILQQNKPLPQRQQNQRPQQQQVQSQGLQQQQQQLQHQIQLLKEKANALSGKQQQCQQQQPPMVEPLKPAPQVQQPKQPDNVEALGASDTDEVQIVEVMETQEIIEDDEDDEVQIVEKPPVEPVPSEYVPKPDDLMRPIKASEVVLQDVPKQKSEDDCRSVWVNNIQPETRRIDLVLYLEQFGDVIHCKIGNSNNCAFTRWAKVLFTTEDAAARAAEYFVHPFQGRYLFVLRCSKYVVEEPGKVFTIDFLSKYVVYEDVVKAFKGIGEMYYLVRLYDNSFKVRIFFLDKVNEQAVLAVDRIDGRPAKLEPYVENMTLRLPKTLVKELKDEREILDPEKEARLAIIDEINKQEALNRCAIRQYENPNPKSSPVEVVIYNVPVSTTDQQIKRFFKPVGEPTAIRREPIETETHVVREVERAFVGFRTLSMAMQAAEIPPEKTLNSYNPFIFTAWTQALMSDKNTVRLFFNKFISIQDIYSGLSHCGPIKYIEKQRAKRALVVFGNGETGLLNTKKLNYIGDTKITNQDFTEIHTTAGAIDDVVDIASPSDPTTAPPLSFASHEINIGSKSSGSSKTPNPIPIVATPNNELPTSAPTGKNTKGPTAPDHCNYVFGTWRVSKLLSQDDCLKIDIFLRQYDVSVAYLQEVKFKRAKVTTKFYHWHIIKPQQDAQTWSEQIKSGGAILLRQSLMQTASFKRLRNLSTVQLLLFSRPLTVAFAHVRTEGMDQQPDPEIVRMQNDIEKMNAKKRGNFILLGHFNARIGSEDTAALQGLVGEHLGYTVSDRNGQVLKEILQSNQLKLISSFGPSPNVQWTCTQAGKQEQIDHIVMSDMTWVKQPECRTIADHCFVSDNRLLLLSLKWPFTKRFAKMKTKELLKSTTENHAEKLEHRSEPKKPTPCKDTLIKNMCESFIFATWNVSGCARESDREIVDEMLHSHGITVACIQETQMKPGSVLTKNYKWFNVNCSKIGTDSAQIEGGNAILINSTLSRESWCESKSDNICCATVCMPWGQLTIISVYARSKQSRTQPDMELATLKKIVSHLAQEKKHYIILGDFNARFGIAEISNETRELFGDHLLHNRSNANGRLIQKMMRSHKLKLISSFGPSPSVRFTCEKDNREAQIDHILIPCSNELQNIECQCIDGEPRFSNHRLLTIKASYSPKAARTSTGPEIAALAYGPEPFRPNEVGNTKKKAAQKSSPSTAPSSSQNASVEDTIKIATWNVSGCKLELERDNIDEHLNSFKITVACLQDTRLQNNTTFETENYTWFNYNQETPSDIGGNAIIVRNDLLTDCTFQRWSSHICSVKLHFFGSDFTIYSVHACTEGNDKQPDPELNTLYDIISRMSPDERDSFIVLGSLNAKIGSQELLPGLEPYIGKCLAHTQNNPNGEFIQKILMEYKLHLSSSFCYKNLQSTWKRGDEEAQIDHVFMPFVNKFWPPRCHCIRSLTGYSDHRIIMVRLKHRRRPLDQDNTEKSAYESTGQFVATRLDMYADKKKKQAEEEAKKQAAKPPSAIVIEDEDEVVEVSKDSQNKNENQNQNQKGKNQQHRDGPQNKQHQQQRLGGKRNRNSNSFGDGGGPPQRRQQFHPNEQRHQMAPRHDRIQPFQRQLPPMNDFDFMQRVQHQFGPDGPFNRFGNQGPPNMNINEFEQMMMAQQFNLNNDNGFNNMGNPMNSMDPPLEHSPWERQHQQQQQHFDRFTPPGRRSPFNRGFPDDRDDNYDQGFGRDSPGLPGNIPDDEIDEYIMRKQEAIKRRLEQLDKQLISSVEMARQRDFEQTARRRPAAGTVFSDNGDVHYVPNPAAVARNRGRREGNFRGGRRGGRGGDGAFEGPSRRSQEGGQSQGSRGRQFHGRARDPFADVDIVPIIRISEERSPSPKRSREDNFDTAQFDAAWN